MIFLAFTANAQRKRTTATFDADTTTRPTNGLYGIGVRDKQPFLVSPSGEAKRFMMEDKFIKAHWFSVEEDTAVLPKDKSVIFLGGGDSTYIKLPIEPDTAKNPRTYSILFFGWKGGNDSTTYMQEDITRYMDLNSAWKTFRVIFSDTVYYQRGWKGEILKSKSFSDSSNMPLPFFLYPKRWINIRRKEGKWWLI